MNTENLKKALRDVKAKVEYYTPEIVSGILLASSVAISIAVVKYAHEIATERAKDEPRYILTQYNKETGEVSQALLSYNQLVQINEAAKEYEETAKKAEE